MSTPISSSVVLLRVRSNVYYHGTNSTVFQREREEKKVGVTLADDPNAETSSKDKSKSVQDPIKGYLCMAQIKATEAIILLFIPTGSLTPTDIPIYEQLSEYYSTKSHELPISPPTIPILPNNTVILSNPLSSISRLDIHTLTAEEMGIQIDAAAMSIPDFDHPEFSYAVIPHDVRIRVFSNGGSSDPKALFHQLVVKYPTGDVDSWLHVWMDVGMMDMKRSQNGSETFMLRSKYAIQDFRAMKPQNNSGQDIVSQFGWNILEKLTKVTLGVKDVATQVLQHPLSRPLLPFIPPPVLDFLKSSPEASRVIEEYETAGDYLSWVLFGGNSNRRSPQFSFGRGKQLEVDSDSDGEWEVVDVAPTEIFVHHRVPKPMTAEELLGLYDKDGKLSKMSEKDLREKVFFAGLEHDIRPVAWKYLLGVFPWDSTESERAILMEDLTKKYFELKNSWQDVLAQPKPASSATDPPRVRRQGSHYGGDEDQDMSREDKIRERKYRVEKDVVRTDRNVPYFMTSTAGTNPDDTSAPQQSNNGEEIPASALVIDERGHPNAEKHLEMLRHILMTYTMYEFDLGYVQGMNDLLAPLLVVFQDEVDAFWGFVKFMELTKGNFSRTQLGMKKQLTLLGKLLKFLDPQLWDHLENNCDSNNLFCSFRWLLVLFKRELEFLDVMRLWEVLWSNHLSSHFHLFVAYAIFELHRPKLMEVRAFDEVLKVGFCFVCLLSVFGFTKNVYFSLVHERPCESITIRCAVTKSRSRVLPISMENEHCRKED